MRKHFIYIQLFFICFLPTIVLGADNKEEEKNHPILHCEHLHQEGIDHLDQLIALFQEDHIKNIEQRINQLMTSKDDIQTEKIIVDLASCYERINEDTQLTGMFELYASFLTYIEQSLAKKQHEQITSLSITHDELRMVYQLDTEFLESENSVHIDHFYSWDAYSNAIWLDQKQTAQAVKEAEENEPSSIESLAHGIANQSYQFFQNPIEKVLSITDEYTKGIAEKEQALFRNKSLLPSTIYGFAVSLIEIDAGTKNQEFMTEYYPTSTTHNMLERLENVHDVVPSVEYPRALVEQRRWLELMHELERIEGYFGLDQREVWDYIVSGTTPKNTSEESYLNQLEDDD